MNRNITEPWSLALPPDRQGEFFHRYILGVYDLYARLTTAFPDILFESCASGGGRFDPGLLAFAPQAWTSDDTDAVERLKIQWGTSLAYPVSSMGAHVSAVPNHQVGRVTPLATRAAVAFFGVLGYELDPTVLTADERREVADQVAFYVANREVLQYGHFVRLRSPFEGDGNTTAWMSVSPDRRRAVVGFYRVLNVARTGPGSGSAARARPRPGLPSFRLAGRRRFDRPSEHARPRRRRPHGGGPAHHRRERRGRCPRRLLGTPVRPRGDATDLIGRVFSFLTARVRFALDHAARPTFAMMTT